MANDLTIAVSGSTGLVGSAFLRRIPANVKVNNRVQLRNLSMSEISKVVESISREGVEVFLHLGWPASTSEGNYRDSESNFDAIQRTLFLKEACLNANIAFIGIGSVIDGFFIGGNLYQMSKFVCRQILKPEIEKGTITWIRPHFVFNDQSWPEFLHGERTRPILIHDNSARDFIHLEDVISGLWAVIQNRLKGEIDLGSGILKSPSDLCGIYKKKFEVHPDFVESMGNPWYQSAKLSDLLAEYWVPTKTLDLFKEKK